MWCIFFSRFKEGCECKILALSWHFYFQNLTSKSSHKGVTSVLYSIAVLENFIQDKKEGVFATIHERVSRHDIMKWIWKRSSQWWTLLKQWWKYHYCLSGVHCCEDHFHIRFFNRCSHIWFWYIYSNLVRYLIGFGDQAGYGQDHHNRIPSPTAFR